MSRLTCGHIQHMYSWWWVRLSPETCRVKPLRKIKTQLLYLVGLISLLWRFPSWTHGPTASLQEFLVAELRCLTLLFYFWAISLQFKLTSDCLSSFSEFFAYNLKISHLCYVCDWWQANILCSVGSYVLCIKYNIFCLAPVFLYLSIWGRKLNENFTRTSRYCTF